MRTSSALAASVGSPATSAVATASWSRLSACANSPIWSSASPSSGKARAGAGRAGRAVPPRVEQVRGRGHVAAPERPPPADAEPLAAPPTDAAAMIVERAELGEVAVRLLQVVAEDLLVLGLAPALAVDLLRPVYEPLVQGRRVRLSSPVVGGFADQDVLEAEAAPRRVRPIRSVHCLRRERRRGARNSGRTASTTAPQRAASGISGRSRTRTRRRRVGLPPSGRAARSAAPGSSVVRRPRPDRWSPRQRPSSSSSSSLVDQHRKHLLDEQRVALGRIHDPRADASGIRRSPRSSRPSARSPSFCERFSDDRRVRALPPVAGSSRSCRDGQSTSIGASRSSSRGARSDRGGSAPPSECRRRERREGRSRQCSRTASARPRRAPRPGRRPLRARPPPRPDRAPRLGCDRRYLPARHARAGRRPRSTRPGGRSRPAARM